MSLTPLSDDDITTLRGSYLRDFYTPAVVGVSPASGLSYFNRTVEANFIEDDALQLLAERMQREFAYQLQSVYAAELDWQKAAGTSIIPYLTTDQCGNRDLTFTAKNAADDITIAYIVSGASTPLSVSVTGKAIVVNLATTSGSIADSIANAIKTIVDATPAAFALVSTALATGGDGTGKPSGMATTHLMSDAQRAASALQQDAFFGYIQANVFESMAADGGFSAAIPASDRAIEVAELKDRAMKVRQFVEDKTVHGRRRVAAR